MTLGQSQHTLFSAIANQQLYTSVYAESSRDGVRVYIHHDVDQYPRPPKGMKTERWVRMCVATTVRRVTDLHRPMRSFDPDVGWSITYAMPHLVRGEWHFNVWMPTE